MNQKRVKVIRRIVRCLGHVKADYPLHHRNMGGRFVESSRAMFPVVVTARYQDNSFQHQLKKAKRALRSVSTYVLRERAELYADMRADHTAA